MTIKNLAQISAIILSGFVIISPIKCHANTTVEDVLEMAYDDLENSTDVENGTTIIKSDEETTVEKEIVKNLTGLEIGDVVTVNGIGNTSSKGDGAETKEYENASLAIVNIKNKDAKYPYALASVNQDNTIGEIVGWFKAEDITARYVIATTTEYADIQKTIVDVEDVPEYNANSWEFLNEYYEYINGKYIQSKYIWPEVTQEYDESYTVKFENNIQTKEFYNGDDIFYIDYDWSKGTVTYVTQGRDKAKTLEKKETYKK